MTEPSPAAPNNPAAAVPVASTSAELASDAAPARAAPERATQGAVAVASNPAPNPAPPAPGEPTLWGMKLSLWFSLAGFIISVVGAIYLTTGYIQGPDVRLLPPRAISFWYLRPAQDEYLSMSAVTMAYENRGRKDYDGLVLEEYALVTLPGRAEAVRLDWWWFMVGANDIQGQARPEVVPGAGVINHETRMNPRLSPCTGGAPCSAAVARKNFVPWIEFLSLAEQPSSTYIDVRLLAKVRNRKVVQQEVSCRAYIDEVTRTQMALALKQARAAAAKGTPYDKFRENANDATPREYFGLTCTYADDAPG